MNDEILEQVNGGSGSDDFANAVTGALKTGMNYTVSAALSVKDAFVSAKNTIFGWFN